MTVIKVPRPPTSAFDPGRPVSGLLKMQMEHLHQAELKLPVRRQTDVYINAVRTEGEAAAYIRAVTEAIHSAHAEAVAKRVPRAARPIRVQKRKPVIEIAAVAEERPRRVGSGVKKNTKKKIGVKKSSKRR
jgi:hypothetical protein